MSWLSVSGKKVIIVTIGTNWLYNQLDLNRSWKRHRTEGKSSHLHSHTQKPERVQGILMAPFTISRHFVLVSFLLLRRDTMIKAPYRRKSYWAPSCRGLAESVTIVATSRPAWPWSSSWDWTFSPESRRQRKITFCGSLCFLSQLPSVGYPVSRGSRGSLSTENSAFDSRVVQIYVCLSYIKS